MFKSSFVLVALLIIGAASVGFVVPTATANTQTNRLGFWLQEGDISNCTWQQGYQQCGAADPAQLFFNSMFLTPPYPTSVEVMIFAILQAQTNSQGCTTTSGYIGNSIAFWGDLAKLADSYPNIRLVYEIGFNPSNGGTGTYGLSCFNSMVQAFGSHPSIYGLGVEGEYTFGVSNAQMVTAMNDVKAVGKVFVSYYIHGAAIPSGGYMIAHTNFPAAGDQVGTLGTTSPVTIGLDSGYYYSFPFPQNAITCPIGPNVIVTGSVEGWNQCVVSTELSKAVSLPAGQRQFLELDPGFSSSGSFTGASGQTTNQLWDNPTLRNWIWTDPSYQPNFILSTSSTPPPTTTTTTASSTATSSTTTSTPPPPPGAGPQLIVLPTGVPFDPLAKQTLGYSISGGPPGVTYNIKIRTPAGVVQAIAIGTVDAKGSGGGTMSFTFDVQNAIFVTKAVFDNGASSNLVGIQVGPSITTSTTSTSVIPSTSSTVASLTSSSTFVTTATSQQTTTLRTTTSTTTSVETTTSTTTDNGDGGGDGASRNHGRSVPIATFLQSSTTTTVNGSSTTTSANGGNIHQEQGSGFSSTMGTATGFALGVTAGMALGLVVLTVIGRGIGNFSFKGSGHQRGKEKVETANTREKKPSLLRKNISTGLRLRLKPFAMAASANWKQADGVGPKSFRRIAIGTLSKLSTLMKIRFLGDLKIVRVNGKIQMRKGPNLADSSEEELS